MHNVFDVLGHVWDDVWCGGRHLQHFFAFLIHTQRCQWPAGATLDTDISSASMASCPLYPHSEQGQRSYLDLNNLASRLIRLSSFENASGVLQGLEADVEAVAFRLSQTNCDFEMMFESAMPVAMFIRKQETLGRLWEGYLGPRQVRKKLGTSIKSGARDDSTPSRKRAVLRASPF